MENIIYTWEELHFDVDCLVDKIKRSKFNPQEIVGIARGGLIPAVMISHKLKIPMTPIVWSKRDIMHRDFSGWLNLVTKMSLGLKVLFVEDIIDSGQTIEEIIDIGDRYQNSSLWRKNLMIVSLWCNQNKYELVNFTCRFIDRETDKRWIVFPFEA